MSEDGTPFSSVDTFKVVISFKEGADGHPTGRLWVVAGTVLDPSTDTVEVEEVWRGTLGRNSGHQR